MNLFEGCNENGFNILMKFYLNEEIDINNSNIFDILLICVCYDEEELLNYCIDYMKENLNEEFAISLLTKSVIIKSKYFKEFEIFLNDYLIKYGYILLRKENILKFSIENIQYILNRNEMIINEIELLESLLLFMKEKGSRKEICEIISNLNVNKININGLNEEKRNILKEMIESGEIRLIYTRNNIPNLININQNFKK